MGSHHACPKCGQKVEIIHRKRLDRIVSHAFPVHRYACRNASCRWEGLLASSRRRPAVKGKGMKKWMWAAVLAVSLTAAAAISASSPGRAP